jgi:hypothetical protein
MKRLGVTSLLLGALVLGIAGWLFAIESNPLRRSEDGLRTWVLQKTPLGSSRSQVIAVSAREKWGDNDTYVGTGMPPNVGVTHFGADVGSYHGFLLPCHVHAYWSFDADDKLIDVYVFRWCEGL